MSKMVYSSLQVREVFHLEFLRWFVRKVKAEFYALKGGANLRFFFNSFRYSEDMDIDIQNVSVDVLKDAVMKILRASSFQEILKPFGIERIVPPNIASAKQAETTQRFKVHLVTFAGEDLFTKIEFSRRGFKGTAIVQPVQSPILREYKLPPLLVPHYDVYSAVGQKIGALAARSVVQARDIFDLYVLSAQCEPLKMKEIEINNADLAKASENVFEISFKQFQSTVIAYLSTEDQAIYKSSSLWDEIKLKVVDFTGELRRQHG